MRETLHQLTLALALPLTVGAFWIARAERAEPAVRERATAYRVELAQLPLPHRERLRSPGLPTATSAPRSAPEQEIAPRQRRPALPEPSETVAAPLDLPSRAGSAPAEVAAPSPRPSLETLGAAPRNLPRVAAPAAMAAPSLSSRGGDVGAPGTVIAGSAPNETAAPAAKPSPPEKTPVSDPEPNPFRRPRLLEPQDAPVVANPRDPRLLGRPNQTPSTSPVRGLPRFFPIAHQPVRSDPTPSPKLVSQDGRAPLVPTGKLADLAYDFSLPSGSEPSVLPDALPPLPSEADETRPGTELAFEIQLPSPFANWTTLKPGFLLIIPEPGTASLLGAALAALGALRRGRRRA